MKWTPANKICSRFFHKVSSMLFELPFNRDMETEADEVGLKLAAKACFDVREAPAFWAKMELVSYFYDKLPLKEALVSGKH